jgi:putative hemolysin
MNSMQVKPSQFATRFSVTLSDDDISRQKYLSFKQRFREISTNLNDVRELSSLYDRHGTYLLVSNNDGEEIIAAMRVTTAEHAVFTNGFEAETRFELSALLATPATCMELGRLYILSGYEPGKVLHLMYRALRRLVARENSDGFFTRISLPLYGGDRFVQTLVHSLRHSRFALPAELVKPRVRLRCVDEPLIDEVVLPAVLRSFLKLGARVCSEPYWDAELGIAEILLWFESDCLPEPDATGFFNSPERNTPNRDMHSGMRG